MQRTLIAAAVIATLVSPVRAQSYGMPSGQGSTAPSNPNTTPVPPASNMRLMSPGPSEEASPSQSQYQPLTQPQLNQIHSNPNQSRPEQPEGPLR
jgi:hypothetical protein